MRKNKSKYHRPAKEKQLICKLRDAGIAKKLIEKRFKIPRQSLKDLKPDREFKYKEIQDYFLNYIKAHHRELILVKLGRKERKQISKILIYLTTNPDNTLKNLIRNYKEQWGHDDILSRRRKEGIMEAIEEIPQTIKSIETLSIYKEQQFFDKQQIFQQDDDQEMELEDLRQQMSNIVIDDKDFNENQLPYYQQEQVDLYDQFEGESQPQFGSNPYWNTVNLINFNDIDENQYPQNQSNQIQQKIIIILIFQFLREQRNMFI